MLSGTNFISLCLVVNKSALMDRPASESISHDLFKSSSKQEFFKSAPRIGQDTFTTTNGYLKLLRNPIFSSNIFELLGTKT